MCVGSICDVCGGGDVSSVLTVGHVQNVSAVTCVGLARRERRGLEHLSCQSLAERCEEESRREFSPSRLRVHSVLHFSLLSLHSVPAVWRGSGWRLSSLM